MPALVVPERPQDLPFVQQMEVVNSACQWGTACNAGAGMGRLVPDLYTVGRFALITRPGSKVRMMSSVPPACSTGLA